MNGVCISCDGIIAKDLINQLREVYFCLQSISKILKTEQFRSDKIAERIWLYISESDITNKDLLSESKIYLDLMNSLYNFNKSCLTMLNTMLKIMDIYFKLRMRLRDMKSDWESYWSFIEKVDIYHNEEIIHNENEEDSSDLESGFDHYINPDKNNIFTLRDYYFHCKDELLRIEINSEQLELLIALVYKQFVTFRNKNSLLYTHFLLYRTFKDYYQKTNQFLRSTKKI